VDWLIAVCKRTLALQAAPKCKRSTIRLIESVVSYRHDQSLEPLLRYCQPILFEHLHVTGEYKRISWSFAARIRCSIEPEAAAPKRWRQGPKTPLGVAALVL
jgi:hypothetical protein